MPTATDLIERSISHTEIAHAPYAADLAEALREASDDSVETERGLEYWGERDGDEWRVHLDR